VKDFESKLIHKGASGLQKKLNKNNVVCETLPVYRTSVFSFGDSASVDDIYDGRKDGYIYSRIASPNSDAASEIIAAADDAKKSFVFSSGMSAITLSILAILNPGDHLISSPVLYGGVHDFFANELKRLGIEVSFVDFINDDPASYIKPNTKLIYTETISNPLMQTADIAHISKIARSHKLVFAIDNTFATPALVKPLNLGADLVLYSATKYLGGHSDIIAGAVSVNNLGLADKIKRVLVLYGAILGAEDAWLLARSLRTLDLRIAKHCANALKIATFLSGHKKVERVYFPGLKSDPFHKIACAQFQKGRFGAMMSVDFKGGARAVNAFIKKTKIAFVPSLAGTATTFSYAIKTSHRFYDKAALRELGIKDGQLRFSIGLENADDIIEELSRALK
jgi:methionine-gamma-lyase